MIAWPAPPAEAWLEMGRMARKIGLPQKSNPFLYRTALPGDVTSNPDAWAVLYLGWDCGWLLEDALQEA